jgi:hypothetical protein
LLVQYVVVAIATPLHFMLLLSLLEDPSSQTHAADSLNDLASSSLVLSPNKAVCDVKLIHIVIWVVAERKMRRLRAPLWYAATNVTGNRDRVQHVTVLKHIEDYAHVGELA